MPRAADKWLKLESLQIDKSQLFIIGKISLIDKLSKGKQRSPNLDFSISFNNICSSLFLPVAKKIYIFLFLIIFQLRLKMYLLVFFLLALNLQYLREYLFDLSLFEIYRLI